MSEAKWFTKTIAREALSAAISELEDISEASATILNELFASKRKGGGATTTVTVEGEVIGKKCSYLQRYLPISEFGTLGKNEDETPKYAYQSKEGAKLARKAKSEFEEAIKNADLELEETEDISAWKEAKLEAKTAYEVEVESDEGFATADELIDSL